MILSFQFKKNLLVAFIILAIILLAANILLQRDTSNTAHSELSVDGEELTQRFRKILNEFGIEERFIKETSLTDKKSKNQFSKFKVQVPGDLSIPEILQQIYISYRNDSLTINSVEKIKGGKSILELKFGPSTLLEAEFVYAKNYSRDYGSIAFIIYDVNLDNQSTMLLIESATKLNFLIRPETKYLQYLDILSSNSQQYSILIDDDISEQKYQLGPGFSEQRIKTVVKTLVNDFTKAVCFIIDDKSDFFNTSNYKVLQSELQKRNIKLFKLSDFVYLKNDEIIKDVFDEKINSLKEASSMIFLVDEDSFLALRPEIVKFKMKGFKVSAASLLFAKN